MPHSLKLIPDKHIFDHINIITKSSFWVVKFVIFQFFITKKDNPPVRGNHKIKNGVIVCSLSGRFWSADLSA